jgi:hypothetical protein
MSLLVGPKTIHFWAPMFKWGLVIAGLTDINRPVEKVSLLQSTGIIVCIIACLILRFIDSK